MPELPEVETVRRGLAQAVLVGARIEEVEQLAQAQPARLFPSSASVERLVGRRIESPRGGRNISSSTLDSGETLIMHLGMSGSFRPSIAGADGEETPGAFHFETLQGARPTIMSRFTSRTARARHL